MTLDDFRRIALSMPEATEGSHMEHPDFRVKGKIFATLWVEEEWGMVKLTPEQQAEFIEAAPKIFTPVKGGWGERGATLVVVAAANAPVLRRAIATAWRNTAPKRLAQEHGPFDDE